MASGAKLFYTSLLCFTVWITLIGLTHSSKENRLEILPLQSVQRKPVGKSLMLTCKPQVVETNLITDLRWRDNKNLTILPKINGQKTPAMYTETLPGGQSLALIIPSLQETMEGDYFCSASYANTELLEARVTIETYVAITWNNAPEFQYPTLGSDYLVRCEVTANPPPTVDWLRNGDPIKSSGRYVVETKGLLIKNVQEIDDGVYTCRAAVILTGELIERTIRVEVQIKPEITNLSSIYEAVEGQEFSVQCMASGKPVPEYVWVNDRTIQNVVEADRFSVNSINGQMSISRVEEQDHGEYTCRAKNPAGEAEQKMKLNVLVRPKIYELWNITMAVETEARLVCKATGRPPPEITFRRWGTKDEYVVGPQPNDDRIILEMSFDEERGESVGTLAVTKLIRSDDGLYECVARNKGDTAYKVGHITVEFPPTFDHMKGFPPVYSWEERKANLSCLAVSIPNATVEWRWNDRLVTELYDKNMEVVNAGPRADLLIIPRERRYYTAYKCIATNRLGRVEHVMELREARIPDAIVQAKPKTVTATSMTFDIIGPATELGLPILAYSVQYKEERNPDWSIARNRTWTPDSPYIVEGLLPQTSFNFRFAARNLVGLGQWSAYRTQSTPSRSVPEPPKILHSPVQEEDGEESIITSPYTDRFEMRWNIPFDNGEIIDYYQIHYCPGHKINGIWNEVENLCRTIDTVEYSNHELRDLTSDTYYRVELRAHNAIGFSTPTNFLLKTARGIDVIGIAERPHISSMAIVGIAIAGVLILLIIVDFLCCITVNIGIFATLCRKTKRSPSDLDDEAKLGSGSLIKERPPSPLPLPPPIVSLEPAEIDERQPLNAANSNNAVVMKNSTVDYDGRVVHSRSGDLIGKNSAV